MGILMRIILGLSVAAALVAVPSVPAQSGFAPITLSTNGERPSIAVDEEGTAHVAWNERVTDGADVLHYCRVPRGATACEGEQRLVPPDGEARFNTDTAGPRVLLTGPEDVALLTFRYPNVVTVNRQGSPDPDCYEKFPLPSEECYGSSSKTWIYRSTDGGATFRPPRIFSHRAPSGDAVVLYDSFGLPAPGIEGQSGTGPLIATVTETEGGGTYFASAPPDGYARTTANLGDEGPDRAYGGTVAPLDDATPVAAFNDLSSNLYIRQWRGAGPRNDIANWAPAQRVDAGEEPHLAGGPGGVFLLYRPRVDDLPGDRFVVRRWRDGALGPGVAVSDRGSVAQADLFEDESGRLHAAWVRRGADGDALRYRFSPDGTSFSEPFGVGTAGASEIWNVDLGAAGDGGGWAVWSSTLSGNGRVSIAPFGTQEKRVIIDARVTAIEVTQGIQTVELPRRTQATSSINGVVRYSGVPLAADNWTFVRVYANVRRDVPGGATVPNLTLQAFRDGKPVGPPVLPETRPPSLAAGALDEVTDAQRYTPANAYTFAIPWQTARGDVTFVAEINPAGLLPSLDECRICRQDNALRLTGVRFQPVDRITVFPVEIDVGANRPAGAPDLYRYFSRPGIETFSPLAFRFAGTIPVIDAAGLIAFPRLTQAQKEGGLAQAVKDLAAAAGRGGNDVYPFGIFPNGQGAGNGLTVNGPLYSGTPPVSIAADTRPLTSMGHEFYHGIGRVHAGLNCGGNDNGQVGEAWPPGADGEMDGVALDTRGAPPYRIISNSSVPAPANPLYDLMSYCPAGAVDDDRDWISVLNWTRAIAFNAPAVRATRRAVTRQAPARTLRFYTIVAPDAPAGGTFVTPDAGNATPVDPASEYLLVARDAQGRDLATAGAVVEPVRTHSGNVAIISGRVAAPGAASVVLLQNGQPIAARTASANAPKVRVLSPRRGARVGGRTVQLRWRATDADQDPLRVAIEYSQDGGARWTGIHSGPSAGKVALPARLFTASRKARVRVRVQDGFRETSATSARFVSRGAPPLVSIAAPAKGARVAAGTSLALEGDAFDDRGEALEGKRLVWRDGRRRIGTGRRVLSRGLAPGRHVIMLQARDRRGRVSRTSVTVRVTRAAPQLRVLKAPASLGRGARRVTLRVAATFPIRLRAGGRRYAISTRPRAIRVKVKPGRSLLQLRLVLSAAGSSSSVTVLIPRR